MVPRILSLYFPSTADKSIEDLKLLVSQFYEVSQLLRNDAAYTFTKPLPGEGFFLPLVHLRIIVLLSWVINAYLAPVEHYLCLPLWQLTRTILQNSIHQLQWQLLRTSPYPLSGVCSSLYLRTLYKWSNSNVRRKLSRKGAVCHMVLQDDMHPSLNIFFLVGNVQRTKMFWWLKSAWAKTTLLCTSWPRVPEQPFLNWVKVYLMVFRTFCYNDLVALCNLSCRRSW